MGRSTDNHNQNPATRFYRWNGGDGTLTYYDGEKNVAVPFSEKKPFKFLVVERGAQITGGYDHDGEYVGFYSNFVRDTTKEPFIVKSKRGQELKGLYADLKGEAGVKYATALYIGVPTENGLELQFVSFSGAALNGWIEATKGKDIFKGAFAITGSTKGKKGAVTYHIPTFKYIPDITEDTDLQAKQLDRVLQEYLGQYFANGHQENGHKEPEKALAATADHNADLLGWGTEDVGPEPPMPVFEPTEPPEDDPIPF